MATSLDTADTIPVDTSLMVAGIRDYWKLLKPGVMALVVFTGAVGVLAAPGDKTLFSIAITILCIALGSGAGAALNMWYDADIDAIMTRTRKRPIPAGLIAADDVLVMGLALSALSVTLLGLCTNWAAGGLLAFAIWFYACFYTMILKRRTNQNIVIGGAAGAFPPMIGWLAISPMMTLEPIVYFLIIFFWTPPHFWALALYRNDDYTRANIPMLPVNAGIPSTLRHIVIYSLILAAISLLPLFLGMLFLPYAVSALMLNGLFLHKAIRLWRTPNNKHAMGLFGYSILYLFLLFSAVIVDKILIWSGALVRFI
jgi:heme o synthase